MNNARAAFFHYGALAITRTLKRMQWILLASYCNAYRCSCPVSNGVYTCTVHAICTESSCLRLKYRCFCTGGQVCESRVRRFRFFYVRANIHYCTVCVILLPAVFPALVKSRLKHRCWIGERKIIQPSPCSLDGGWMTQQKREAKGDATCVGWLGFPRIQLTHIECRLKCLIICCRKLLISINHDCHVSTPTEKIKDHVGPGEKGTNIRSPSNA